MSHTIQTANEAFYWHGYAADTIFFFDFDGVLADQEEEKVFRLPEIANERAHLEAIGKLNGIDPSLYHSTRYLRHLIYQANALGEPVKPHTEAVEFAQHLTRTGQPYFIITARSGFWAVQRMIKFCETWELMPQESFCLGRLSKATLLEQLRLEWPDRPFVFFEDSAHHIQAAKNLGDPNLEIIEVEWPACMEDAKRARRERLGF
jgi:hypothetical protein